MRKAAMLLSLILLLAFLAGCGTTTIPAQVPEAKPSAPVTEPSPRAASEPSFAEAHGFVFSAAPQETATLGAFEGIYGSTVFAENPVVIGVPSVSCSEADKNGNVTWRFDVSVSTTADATYPIEEDNAFTVGFKVYQPYDAYTGYYFNLDHLSTQGNETVSGLSVSGSFDCRGREIAFSGQKTLSAQWSDPTVSDMADGMRNVTMVLTAVQSYSITLPADYDGLIFGLNFGDRADPPSVTSAEDYRYPAVWEGDSSRWLFVRAADLVSPAGAAKTAAGSADDLLALLERVKNGKQPATAGYSLALAAETAEMADLLTEAGLSADEVRSRTQSYLQSLSGEERDLLLFKLDGLAVTFETSDGGSFMDILADSGYTPRHAPWDVFKLQPLFNAMADAG